jgi:hypothetical protein
MGDFLKTMMDRWGWNNMRILYQREGSYEAVGQLFCHLVADSLYYYFKVA